MQGFRRLHVWEKAHDLTLEVYQATVRFPKEEIYALSSQTKRAASSIGANIAEGCGRGSDADFARFLLIAMGSASELEYHLLLARDLKFLPEEDYQRLDALATEVKRMLGSLIQKTRGRTAVG
ncbi:MAG: diversity-generating retroelement protein bAvd family protein [Acidobacteria bacterium]|nr:MAG: diversity-generating retroelement protein bAvd family protein [Acidobacteriota bacterium]